MENNYLAQTPANFRAELARYRIMYRDIAQLIGMNPSFFSGLVNEIDTLNDWAAHNIAWGINHYTGKAIFRTSRKLKKPVRGRPRRIDLYPLAPEDDTSARRVPGGF